MTRACRVFLVLPMGLLACQEPGQSGPMSRAGAYIDRTVGDTQREMADFSQRAGQSLDQAGQAVGAGARRVGTTLHDGLLPTADRPPAPDVGNNQSGLTNVSYPRNGLPPPTPVAP